MKTLVLVLLLGILIRMPTIVSGWYAARDINTYIRWGQTIEARGLENAYAGTDISYPPMLLYLFGGTIWLGGQLGLDSADAPGESRWATLVIQVVSNVADLLIASLLAWVMWRRSHGLGILVAALYLFNPAVWYVSAVWGQTDSILTLLLLASVIALDRKNVLWAWAFYALALATKLQAIALAPLIIIWSLAKHGWRGLLGGLAVAGTIWAVLFAPWTLSGHGADLVHVYATPVEMRTVVSAYNFWYLALGGKLLISSEIRPIALPLAYRDIGTLLFAATALLALGLALRRKAEESLALPAATLALGMFLLLTQMHERHVFPALAFLAWGAAEWMEAQRGTIDSRPVLHGSLNIPWIYGLLTLTTMFNLVTIVPFSNALSTSILLEDNSVRWMILKGTSYVVAGLNVAILVWLVWGARQRLRPGPVKRKEETQPLGTV